MLLLASVLATGPRALAQTFPFSQPGTNPQIQVSPAGPYSPGDTVTFTVVIDSIDAQIHRLLPQPNPDTNLFLGFSGLKVELSGCFDTLLLGPPPAPLYDANGRWRASYTAGPVLAQGGALANTTSGFFFDTDTGCTNPCQTGPNGPFDDNFGDAPRIGAPNTRIRYPGPWTFTWRAVISDTIVGDVRNNPCTLCTEIRAFLDAEHPNNNDRPLTVIQNPLASFTRCITPLNTKIYGDDLTCVNTNATIRYADTLPATDSMQWDFGTNANVLAGNVNGVGPFTVQWTTGGIKPVTYRRFERATGNVLEADTLLVNVIGTLTSGFAISNTSICPYQQTTFTYNGATLPSGAVYTWNFGANAIVTSGGGTGPGPHSVIYPPGGAATRNVSLQVSIPSVGCNSPTTTQTVSIRQRPSTRANVYAFGTTTPLTEACVGDTIVVQYGSTDTAFVRWNYQGGICVNSSPTNSCDTGRQPNLVYWPIAGLKRIQTIVQLNGCRDTANVFLTIKPKPVVDAGSDDYNCGLGDSIRLRGSVSPSNAGCVLQWRQDVDPNWGDGNLAPYVFPNRDTRYWLQAVCNGCTSNVDTVFHRVFPRPNAVVFNPGLTARTCQGGAGAQLLGQGQGGTGRYRFVWRPSLGLSNADTSTPTANPSDTTTYNLVVIDSMGCVSDSAPVQVNVNRPPQARPVLDTTGTQCGASAICLGTNAGICLTAGAVSANVGDTAFRYRWVPDTGLSCDTCPNIYASPDSTTIYCLQATSVLTGCTSSRIDSGACYTVRVNRRPIADAGFPTVFLCRGDSVPLGDRPRGGGPVYRFQWTPSTGLVDPDTGRRSTRPDTLQYPLAKPNDTTRYYLTVTSNGCTSPADSVDVMVVDTPRAVFDTSVFNRGVVDICPGDSIQLNPTYFNVGPTSTYTWVPATGLNDARNPAPFASPLQPTQYGLIINTEGCLSDTMFVTVQLLPPPVVDADTTGRPGGQYYCPQGDSGIRLPAATNSLTGPVYYQWTPLEGLDDPTALNPTARPPRTTTYKLVVTNATCRDSDSVRVVVGPEINARIVADSTRICQGNGVTLQAQGGVGSATAMWSPGRGLSDSTALNPFARPDTTTTYRLTLAEADCEDTASIRIRVEPRSRANFTMSTTEGCAPLTVSFQDLSTNATHWVWYFGDGEYTNERFPVYTYNQPGEYPVYLVTYSEGGFCRDSTLFRQTVRVVEPLQADFSSSPRPGGLDTLRLPNARIAFFNQTSTPRPLEYYWEFGDGQFSFDADPTHVYSRAGTFFPRLIIEDDLGCNDTLQRGPYVVADPTWFAPSVFTPNGDGFNDVFQTDYNGNEAFFLRIYSRTGRDVFRTANPQEGWNGQVDNNGEACPPGVYFYDLRIGDRLYDGPVTLVR